MLLDASHYCRQPTSRSEPLLSCPQVVDFQFSNSPFRCGYIPAMV